MPLLLAIVGGFASGVFLRSLFVFGWAALIFAFLLALLFVAAAFMRPRRVYLFIALFIFTFALGAGRMIVADTPLPTAFAKEIGTKVSYEGVVIADPDIRDAAQRVTIRISQGNETTEVLAVANRYPKVAVGEQVSVYGTLALPQPFASANEGGRVFRYDTYLKKDGIRFLMNSASLTVQAPAPWWSLMSALAGVKHAFIAGLNQTLSEPYASLAAGLIVGGKQGLGSALLDAFVLAGLVQIIVLSGYNVMIVAEGVMRGLKLFHLPRHGAAGAGALAILLFVLMAGAGSASIRAGLMAFIALYARATGRSYAASRALFVVVFLMLIWNPLLLVFDPGFELSVAATAGLVWLSPLFELKLARIKNIFWRSIIATTLAAQAAVLPLLLYQTGTLSLVAIPANLLTLPIIPAAMAFSAIAGLAGIIFANFVLPLALVLSFPAYVLNAYIVLVARVAASLPFAAFHLPAFPFVLVLFAYTPLIFVAWRSYKENAAALVAAAFRSPDPKPLSQNASLPPSS